MLAWENPDNGRRYTMWLERDLFGMPVLTCVYSGRYARKGRIRSTPVDLLNLTKIYRQAKKIRRQHGYRVTKVFSLGGDNAKEDTATSKK